MTIAQILAFTDTYDDEELLLDGKEAYEFDVFVACGKKD